MSVYAISHSVGQCCVKIDYRGLEISIAFDNSCGAGGINMFRTGMRIYRDQLDLTNSVYKDQQELYSLEAQDIKDVFSYIDAYLGGAATEE